MFVKPSSNAAGKRLSFFHARLSLIAAFALSVFGLSAGAQAQQQTPASGQRPNILFIMGDDIGMCEHRRLSSRA